MRLSLLQLQLTYVKHLSAIPLLTERSDAVAGFKPSKTNETETAAVDEKHEQMYNASKAQFPAARVEYYDRGGFMLDGVGTGSFIGDPWFSLHERGDSYSLPMYSIGDLGYSRQAFALTAAAATAANVSDVTPWVLLGGGMVPTFQLQDFRFYWDYPLMNSWQIGRDINQPCPFGGRLGGLAHAKVAVLWPSPTSCACGDPTCIVGGEFCTPAVGDTSMRQQHFVSYVLGANCINMLPNVTTATKGWSWASTDVGALTGPGGCFI